MGERCQHCDEKYSEIDPVHVCSKGPFAPKLPGQAWGHLLGGMPEIDRINLEAIEKRQRDMERRAHIAGLKEALEIAASAYGAKHKEIAATIRSRIAELENADG